MKYSVKGAVAKISQKGPVAVVLSVVFSVLFVTGLVQAATTISTNIATDGTLSVTGASTLTGAVSAIGNLISGRASTTVMSVNNTAFFGGTATTTIGPSGNITQTTTNSATSTLAVGCITTYATSTLTAIRLTFGTNRWATSSVQTADGSNGGANSNSQGLVLWQYGTCPI